MAKEMKVLLPDIGDFKDVEVIEVLVRAGDKVGVEDSLVTLESDKATMEIPSPYSGEIQAVAVKVGDKLNQDDLLLTMTVETEISEAAEKPLAKGAPPVPAAEEVEAVQAPAPTYNEEQLATARIAPIPGEKAEAPPPVAAWQADSIKPKTHASPAVRRFARELGVDLSLVQGSGSKARVTKDDVQNFIKRTLAGEGQLARPAGGALQLPTGPVVDFARFGEVERKPLGRIQRISGPHLHRSWLTVPHVTQFDEADITPLEAFRRAEMKTVEKDGVRLTLFPFILKACAAALAKFPQFNASLAQDGEHLIYKKYFHIGVAVDTPNGLIVPVIRDVDQKGIVDLARELGEVSAKARDGKLLPADLQGGCFSISSLGGIGGTAFTPIINAPEVAILGVSRSTMKPVWNGSEFEPRLMLPLSLSYDHRVIDGADGVRFTSFLSQVLTDLRRLLL